jgi:dihydrofolate reductase
MANSVYIAVSLDGFIATKTGGLEWLMEFPNPEKSDFGYAGFMANIDAIVMGRKTFEKVLSFGAWPYEKPLFVLSNTLKEVSGDLSGKAEIINGDPREIINTLKFRGFKNLYLDGGITIQNFLAEDLVDELIISRIPYLLGDGTPLFGSLEESMLFDHVETEVFDNGIVKSHYTRKR